MTPNHNAMKLGSGLTAADLIEHFAQRSRVILPDYPALDTMAELADGIAGILDREGVSPANLPNRAVG